MWRVIIKIKNLLKKLLNFKNLKVTMWNRFLLTWFSKICKNYLKIISFLKLFLLLVIMGNNNKIINNLREPNRFLASNFSIKRMMTLKIMQQTVIKNYKLIIKNYKIKDLKMLKISFGMWKIRQLVILRRLKKIGNEKKNFRDETSILKNYIQNIL